MIDARCAGCGAPYRREQLGAGGLISCQHCGLVRDMGAVAQPAGPQGLVPLPKRFQVTDEVGRFEVRWRWFTPVYLFLVFFCLAWNGFLFFWYATVIHRAGVMTLLFPLLHVTAGLVFTYWTLCGFTNRTRVSVENGALRVAHGPLPWPGNGVWSRAELMQLSVDRTETRTRNGTTQVWFRLNAVLRDGRLKKLLTLQDVNEARWLERTLEARLGIVDQPVAGELPK